MEFCDTRGGRVSESFGKSRLQHFYQRRNRIWKDHIFEALSDYIPKEERIITIEDNAELQIRGVANLVRLEARRGNTEGENEITIRDLIKSSLRMRPDRIIIGEVRGEEHWICSRL